MLPKVPGTASLHQVRVPVRMEKGSACFSRLYIFFNWCVTTYARRTTNNHESSCTPVPKNAVAEGCSWLWWTNSSTSELIYRGYMFKAATTPSDDPIESAIVVHHINHALLEHDIKSKWLSCLLWLLGLVTLFVDSVFLLVVDVGWCHDDHALVAKWQCLT